MDVCILSLAEEMSRKMMSFLFWKVMGNFMFFGHLLPVFQSFTCVTAENSYPLCLAGHLSGNLQLPISL